MEKADEIHGTLMQPPPGREEVRRIAEAAGDRFVGGRAEIGAEVGLDALSSVGSLCHRYGFIGKDSKGVYSTVRSLTWSEFVRAESERVAGVRSKNGSKGAANRSREAQSASGKKSVDGRPRDDHGRLLPKLLDTWVPQDD